MSNGGRRRADTMNRRHRVLLVPAAIVVAGAVFALIGTWLFRTSTWGPRALGIRIPWLQAYLVVSMLLAGGTALWVRNVGARNRRLLATNAGLREHMAALTQQSPVMLVVADHEGRISAVRGQGLEPVGTAAEDLVGSSVWSAFEANGEVVGHLRAGLKGGVAQAVVEVGERSFELTVRPSSDAEGRVVGLVMVAFDVTRRCGVEREAEKLRGQLRRSNEELEHVRDEAPVGIAVFNEQGRLAEANRKFCAMVGYGEDELRGMTSDELTHPQDIAKSMQANLALQQGGEARGDVEKRYMRKDGSAFEAVTRLRVVQGRGGEGTRMVAVVEDVTEQRSVSARLSEVEAQLAVVLGRSSDAMIVSDVEGRVVCANERVAEFLGIDGDGLVGARLVDFGPRLTTCGAEPANAFERLFSCESVLEFEISVKWPKNRRILASAVPLRTPSGDPVGSVTLMRGTVPEPSPLRPQIAEQMSAVAAPRSE